MRQTLIILVILMFLPASSSAATIYLDPSTATYGRGDTFVMNVRLDNGDECINAAEVEVVYPTETLRAVDFSRGGSIFSLWVREPVIDTEKGTIMFAGGIPGGYCGRIPGDPVVSNVLGKIIFTAISAATNDIRVSVTPASSAYVNDGLGTEASLSVQDAILQIGATPVLSENAWLTQVGEDATPPDAFEIQVLSEKDIFGGKYFIVFSALDKQSGIDHFDIYERGAWKRIESPYQLRDQALRNPVQVRAVDKAGNERIGAFDPEAVPEREASPREYAFVATIVMLLLLAGALRLYRGKSEEIPPPPPVA
ncbi:MAG: cohesin domain-containing protein [Minisyncoccia bacterium]